ncbi:MAG TPA: 3-dehydroquinate synthase [Pyrinomonadaceae bacterium]|nr:3-dehydroquinate synthase [Pyrinomonadaceae bacterium]
MERSIVPIKIPRGPATYRITIGNRLLGDVGRWAAKTLRRESGRVLIVSNPKVFSLFGKATERSFNQSGFDTHVHLIGDGERFKNLRTLEKTLRTLSEKGFTRTDAVVALGGGVVGDLAGFAASIHLRGINLLQIPTTLLSMIDSSVGGKTAVNTAFGKNLVGTFYQPSGVLIDVEVLKTLARREITAGLCEAIKQGAISGRPLFRQTSNFVEAFPVKDFGNTVKFDLLAPGLVDLIDKQVRFKAGIVQNDEGESAHNNTPRSRKILNFGHTFAHALEKSTDYRLLKHGEAVGYGIMFAAELSKKLELLGQDEVNSLNDVVRRAGTLPPISGIDQSAILKSFKHDKKRVGNSLHWVLLRGIGKPVIVPETEIPESAVLSTLNSAFQK